MHALQSLNAYEAHAPPIEASKLMHLHPNSNQPVHIFQGCVDLLKLCAAAEEEQFLNNR
jgi:hypothetical protein